LLLVNRIATSRARACPIRFGKLHYHFHWPCEDRRRDILLPTPLQGARACSKGLKQLRVRLRAGFGDDRNPAYGAVSYFSRLVVSVASDRDPRSCELIADNYDPVARRFISALIRLLLA
jgi:hypothetical protein